MALQDQLRQAIENSGLSLYRIAKGLRRRVPGSSPLRHVGSVT